MKQTYRDWLIIFGCCALVGGGLLYGCHQDGDQTQQEQAHKNETKIHNLAILHDLAAKYSATQDWEKPFTNRPSVFTIDVQDAFLNKTTPLEFTGRLEDIHREAGHVVADFSSYAAPISLSLRLICTQDQRKILTDKAARFAIIANIQTVMKPGGFTVNGGYGEEGIEDPIFDADWASDTYWVTGTCLDLKKLEKLLDE